MQDGGYIKLWRRIRDHWIWRDPERLRAWLDLLIQANYHEGRVSRGGKVIAVARGQVFTSQLALARAWGWDRKTVRQFLGCLQSDQMLVMKTDTHGPTGYTLITICNYESWQGPGSTEPDTHGDTRLDTHAPLDSPLTPHIQEVKKGRKKTEPPPSPSWTDYLETLDPAGREVLGRIPEAVASTRKSGRVAPSVLDGLAREFSRYPIWAVVAGGRIYLDRGDAAEGKGERYLVGIVRGEVKRAGLNGNGPHPPAAIATPGQALIDRTLSVVAAEKGWR